MGAVIEGSTHAILRNPDSPDRSGVRRTEGEQIHVVALIARHRRLCCVDGGSGRLRRQRTTHRSRQWRAHRSVVQYCSKPARPQRATAAPQPDLSTLSASDLLARAKAVTLAANRFRVRGRFTDGPDSVQLDLQLTRAGGEGKFVVGGGSCHLPSCRQNADVRRDGSLVRQGERAFRG